MLRVFDKHIESPTYLFVRGNEKRPDESLPLTPGVPAVFENHPPSCTMVELPPDAWFPSASSAAVATRVEKIHERIRNDNTRTLPQSELTAVDRLRIAALELELAFEQSRAQAEFAIRDGLANDEVLPLKRQAAKGERLWKAKANEQSIAELEVQSKAAHDALSGNTEPDKTAALSEAAAQAAKKLSEAQQLQKELQSKIESDSEEFTPSGPTYPKNSTGRRLALAKWIANKDNPLTAESPSIISGRGHMGSPLVSNMFDFGLRTSQPMHVELLDYLSVRWMDSGWRMKPLHRLIVTSRTYRLASDSELEQFESIIGS